MKTHIICATAHPDIQLQTGRHLTHHGLATSRPEDFAAARVPPITVSCHLGENARSRAAAYARVLRQSEAARGHRFIVIGDDAGLYIRALGDEPGPRIRSWKGEPAPDEEIVSYALQRLAGIPHDERAAQFKAVLSLELLDENGELCDQQVVRGSVDGHILEAESGPSVLSFPFDALFHVSRYDTTLSRLRAVPLKDRVAPGLLSHRELALEAAIPTIKEWLGVPA